MFRKDHYKDKTGKFSPKRYFGAISFSLSIFVGLACISMEVVFGKLLSAESFEFLKWVAAAGTAAMSIGTINKTG